MHHIVNAWDIWDITTLQTDQLLLCMLKNTVYSLQYIKYCTLPLAGINITHTLSSDIVTEYVTTVTPVFEVLSSHCVIINKTKTQAYYCSL